MTSIFTLQDLARRSLLAMLFRIVRSFLQIPSRLRSIIMAGGPRGLGLALFSFLLVYGTVGRAGENPEPAPFTVEVTGTGRPMILIPGLTCGGDVWDGTVAHFKDTFECHVVTLAGFGGKPSVPEPSLRSVVDGLARYIREKKLQRPVIIGHSLGGFLSYWLGIELPGEIGPIVAVDGVPFMPALKEAGATAESQEVIAGKIREMLRAQPQEQFAFSTMMTLSTMITAPEELRRIGATSVRSDPHAVAEAMYELMTIDLRGRVQAIRSPLLLLGSSSGEATPEEKRGIEESYRVQVAAIPHHKVLFAATAHHFVQLDEPAFFYSQVEGFLKQADLLGDR